MKITYQLGGKTKSYDQTSPSDVEMLNSVLINNKGDFLNLGVHTNTTPYHGVYTHDTKTLTLFKTLDQITPEGLEINEIIYKGKKIERVYEKHSVNGQIQVPKDSIYLAPSGGIVYDIENFDEDVIIDLDCRSRDDFDEWGREYSIYKKNDVVMVRYDKKEKDSVAYSVFLGFKAQSFSHTVEGEWVKKSYSYSKRRGNKPEGYVYRLIRVHLDSSQRLLVGTGVSEKEVLDQLFLLEHHAGELETFDENIVRDISQVPHFEKPVTEDVQLAYQLSKVALYNFMNKGLEHSELKQGSYAGIPWFSDVWSRDELASIQSYLLCGEEQYVKEKLFSYLDIIDSTSGTLPIIQKAGSNMSADAVFWLAKRIENLIFYLDEQGKLFDFITHDDLEYFYKRLSLAFNGIIRDHWDKEDELIQVKYADSWMDTIYVNKPIDIQMQFAGFVSCMGVLAGVLGKKKDVEQFLNLEQGLRENIRKHFMREKNKLFQEPDNEKITSNIFLGYYFYPELLLKADWEFIFDEALKHLKTGWGGIRSLSNRDSEYQDNYTGQDNKSYHRGDVWFWINNITTMCLAEVNEKKYRKTISEILLCSTRDILYCGSIGYGSEISSASHHEAMGCTAQLWSSAFYVEMVDKLFLRQFDRKN